MARLQINQSRERTVPINIPKIQPNIQQTQHAPTANSGMTADTQKTSIPFTDGIFQLAPTAYYKPSFVKLIEPDFSKILERRKHVDNLVDVVTATANKRIHKLLERMHKRSITQYYTEHFADIQTNAYEFQAKSPREEALISDIINAENPEELISTIKELEYEVMLNIPSYIDVETTTRNLTPSSEQVDAFNQKISQYGRRMIELRKLLVPKTTEFDVQNCAELLKNYGVEDCYLGNDPLLADKLVDIIEKMHKRNDNIPTGIVVAPSMSGSRGEAFSFDGQSYIVINPLIFEKKGHNVVEKCIEKALNDPMLRMIKPDEQIYAREAIKERLKNITSTDSIFHNIAHEGGHLQHSKDREFRNKPLTEEELAIAEQLSNLAHNSKKRAELYSELYAKDLLTGYLTEAEDIAFDILKAS